MQRNTEISFHIDDIVRVDAMVIGREEDLIGCIRAIHSYHTIIEDQNHIRYSIHFSDYQHIHILKNNGFSVYNSQDFFNDIIESLR